MFVYVFVSSNMYRLKYERNLQFRGFVQALCYVSSSFIIYISFAPLIVWLCNQFAYLAADYQSHHAIQINTESPYSSFLYVTVFKEANSSRQTMI